MTNTKAEFDAQFQEAVQLHQAGKPTEALPIYEKLAAENPTNYEVLHLLGLAHFDLKNNVECELNLKRAIELNPKFAPALFNLGRHYDKIDKFEQALEYLSKAIALQPFFPAAYVVIGHSKDRLGDLGGALAAYDKALTQDPKFVDALTHKGHTLRGARRFEEALVCETMAVSLAPTSAVVSQNRGVTLCMMERYEQALMNFDTAVQLDPSLATAYFQRCGSLMELFRYKEALVSINLALELDVDLEGGFEQRMKLTHQMSEWSYYEADIEEVVKLVPAATRPMPSFTLLNVSNSRELQLQSAASESTKWAKLLGTTPLQLGREGKRLKIGYFSSDFRQHPIAQLFNGVLESHDTSRFEISAFSLGLNTNDSHYKRAFNAAEHFHYVRNHSTLDLINFARSKKLDVAVDLNGYTAMHRAEIFFNRVAPTQINYLGFPGTMGPNLMDYIVADQVLIPEDHQAGYGEKIIYMPNSYQPNDRLRKVPQSATSRAAHGLPETGFVYCNFNATQKLNPAVFSVWMEILKQKPDSVLWLLSRNESVKENLRKEAAARGVDPTRLIFAPMVPEEQHFARLSLANLFLDSWPYNAHTTSSEALWAGLPVLTVIGETFASRVAASILTAAGLPQLIVKSEEEFIRMALELASKPEKLATLKSHLLENRNIVPLFDIELYTRHLENAYEQIVERQSLGLPPDHIHVPSV